MMNRILKFYCFLIFLGLSCQAISASGESVVSEIQVLRHRCILVDPENLSTDAPVVFILHGLGANSNDLFPLIEKMNLPPCRYVLPDAPMPGTTFKRKATKIRSKAGLIYLI